MFETEKAVLDILAYTAINACVDELKYAQDRCYDVMNVTGSAEEELRWLTAKIMLANAQQIAEHAKKLLVPF